MEIDNIQISKTLSNSFNVLIWKNSQWNLFSNHKYESDAKEIESSLIENSIYKVKEYVAEMDCRTNKILASYFLN